MKSSSAPVAGVFTALRRRLWGWEAGVGLVQAMAWILALGAGFVVMDALLDLPEWARAWAPWLVLVFALVWIVGLLWRLWRKQDWILASEVEQLHPSWGTRLTNAVHFQRQKGRSATEEKLRRDAVSLGEELVAQVSAWSLVSPRVRRSAKVLAGAVVPWILLLTLAVDVLREVYPRFVDPTGDHPPYSSLKIQLRTAMSEVDYGGSVGVRATVQGKPVEKLWLVSRVVDSREPSRALMFLSPDRSFFQTLQQVQGVTECYATDGRARSRKVRVGVKLAPQITQAEAVVVWPSYTGRQPKRVKLGGEPQSHPAGSRIQVVLRSNRPLKGGEMTWTPVLGGKAVTRPLAVQNDVHTVAGEWVMEQDVTYAMTVTDVAGTVSRDAVRGRFQVLPDEKPRITVIAPGRDSVATPNISIPIHVEAEDDFGVQLVLWYRSINRSMDRSVPMKMEAVNSAEGGMMRVECRSVLDLSRLGVRPGDVIQYYFEVMDNHPEKPGVAITRAYRLEIISEQEYRSVVARMTAQKALFEEYSRMGSWLRRLSERAGELSKRAEGKGPGLDQEALRREAAEWRADMMEYREELKKLLKQQGHFDVENEFRQELKEQLRRVDEMVEATGGGKGTGVLDQMAQWAKTMREAAEQERERVSQPSQELKDVAQLMHRADEFARMTLAQERVAQMLERYAERSENLSKAEQAEMEELRQQQRRLAEALRNYMKELPELLSKVPDDTSYQPLREDVQQFLRAVKQLSIESDMDDVVKSLEERDTVTAHVLSQRVAERMNQLVSRCRGLGGKAAECMTARFSPRISSAGSSLQQILSAMNGSGSGGAGGGGYGLYGENVGLFGPEMQLAGRPGSQGRQEKESLSGTGRGAIQAGAGRDGDSADSEPPGPGKVRVRADGKFPVKYRQAVSDYFKAISDDALEGGGKR